MGKSKVIKDGLLLIRPTHYRRDTGERVEVIRYSEQGENVWYINLDGVLIQAEEEQIRVDYIDIENEKDRVLTKTSVSSSEPYMMGLSAFECAKETVEDRFARNINCVKDEMQRIALAVDDCLRHVKNIEETVVVNIDKTRYELDQLRDILRFIRDLNSGLGKRFELIEHGIRK